MIVDNLSVMFIDMPNFEGFTFSGLIVIFSDQYIK